MEDFATALLGNHVSFGRTICMFECMCVILGTCACVFLNMCVNEGKGEGGVAVGCYLFVSYPRCLLPSPYQCLCGSTYCTTFL